MNNSILSFIGSDSGYGDNNNSAYIELNNKIIIIDCGMTVFNTLKKKINFNNYTDIEIIITHLHNDHAGSLSQLILYLWFVYNKKAKVISACKHIKEYLKITGTPDEAYILTNTDDNIQFIETEHVQHIDCYGFTLKIGDRRIVYTGDTKILEPFLPYIKDANELYVDVSKNGGVHLQFDDIRQELRRIKENGTNIYLMHIDDREYISNKSNNEFEIV